MRQKEALESENGSRAFAFYERVKGIMFSFLLISYLAAALVSASETIDAPCDGKEYSARSKELKHVFDADQKDRDDFSKWDEKRSLAVMKQDRLRRSRVAKLFAQGCLKSPEDYYHAATVFQHGEVPDHFLQAYYWSMKAFIGGLEEAGVMAANGIDRHLMNTGHKQLFGGQATTDKRSAKEACFCLWPIEESFPEARRQELKFRTRAQLLTWVSELNKGKGNCANGFCDVDAKPTPPGTVPGIW